ncbi:hypothetical protein JCM8097_007286 [Rhodosporidiobolus ruineniae]
MTDGRTLRRLFRSVYCRPPPVRVDGTLEYLVDDVLSAKDGPKAGQHLYEVAWKGYSPAERTWESRDALADTPQMRAAPETVWDVTMLRSERRASRSARERGAVPQEPPAWRKFW